MTLDKDFYNKIAIIITLEFLYKDFDTITTNLLEIGNQIINRIKSIL